MLIVTIFLTSFLVVPTAFITLNTAATPLDLSIPSQVGEHTARVAIYDEDNTTAPVEAGASLSLSGLTNNVDEARTLLEAAGHTVTLLTTQDILNHELTTADYDVFVLINNLPRVSITNLVKEFWLGGGGLLTFHKSFSFLVYEAIIWPPTGSDGYGGLWINHSIDILNVTSRHPAMKDYHINDTVSERASDWVVIAESALDATPVWPYITPLLKNITHDNYIYALAMDSRKEGGRLVHLPGDGSSIPSDFESIIEDSVQWLVPTPKGRIVFDLSHMPRIGIDPWDTEFITVWTPVNSFTQFRTLAVNHSYTFDKLYPSASGNLTAERLAKYDVLVINWPDLDYTSAERAAVEAWIAGGGSLLALGDRTGMSGGSTGDVFMNQLIQNFDMSLGTTDVLNFQTMTPGTHVTLEGCTGLYIGYRNYLVVIGNATPIWFDGTDAVVAGQEFGEGRAILSADMNIFDNSELFHDDNVRYALNALNWLTAADAEILVFDDYLGSGGAVASALKDLRLSHQLFVDNEYLEEFIDSQEWELVIFNAVNYVLPTITLDELYAYVDGGGTLIMTYWNLNNNPTHPLWSKLGVEYSSTISGQPSMYIWDASHAIFTEPNDHGGYNYTSNGVFGDDGDAVTVLDGSTALAGTTGNIQDGTAAIVVSNDKLTLFNGFVIDNFGTDEDDSTYEDRIELWQNEITFMLLPPGGGGTPFNLDPTTLAIIGAAVVGIIVIGVLVMRRRGGGSAPKRKPKKKTTKKKRRNNSFQGSLRTSPSFLFIPILILF
jgi:hypothetical protein